MYERSVIVIIFNTWFKKFLSLDLSSLKKPYAINYNEKNDIRPFEDVTKMEFYCKKNDSSLFMLGNHNKKRPHNIIMGRMYDYQVLDMIELGLENFKSLQVWFDNFCISIIMILLFRTLKITKLPVVSSLVCCLLVNHLQTQQKPSSKGWNLCWLISSEAQKWKMSGWRE